MTVYTNFVVNVATRRCYSIYSCIKNAEQADATVSQGKNSQRKCAAERRSKLECVVSLPYIAPLDHLKRQL